MGFAHLTVEVGYPCKKVAMALRQMETIGVVQKRKPIIDDPDSQMWGITLPDFSKLWAKIRKIFRKAKNIICERQSYCPAYFPCEYEGRPRYDKQTRKSTRCNYLYNDRLNGDQEDDWNCISRDALGNERSVLIKRVKA